VSRLLKHIHDFADEAHQVALGGAHGHLAHVDFAKIHELIHQLQEPLGIAAHQTQVVALGRRQVGGATEQVFHRPQNQGERRTQLVREIGEKAQLGFRGALGFGGGGGGLLGQLGNAVALGADFGILPLQRAPDALVEARRAPGQGTQGNGSQQDG
jgi:hypothetical protein